MSRAPTSASAIAARKSATSSAEYSRGRQARGLWLKIWMARQPRSVPRSTALAGPPAGETWAPISIGPGRFASVASCVHARALRSFADGRAPHRWGADGTVQLAPGPGPRRRARAAHRGHRPRALHAGERRADLRGAALAGARLGRRPRLPVRAPGPARRGRRAADRLQVRI